eukprot:Colp12_sorted_trinity150504_noHs@8534
MTKVSPHEASLEVYEAYVLETVGIHTALKNAFGQIVAFSHGIEESHYQGFVTFSLLAHQLLLEHNQYEDVIVFSRWLKHSKGTPKQEKIKAIVRKLEDDHKSLETELDYFRNLLTRRQLNQTTIVQIGQAAQDILNIITPHMDFEEHKCGVHWLASFMPSKAIQEIRTDVR